MTYKVVYEKRAVKSLSKIDKNQQRLIIAWIEKNLQNTSDPKQHGKSLKGQLKDYWRYRVGNYRLLAEINQDEVKIIVINIGHRKDIYKQ
ncbi:type II toxin-antitoxin system RelE family toxin [Salinicoccus roseus]|uniref:RelE/StbE family addiction module toxin n=1 Tax=Salinicoccus roseus TaxID=45670 RepID=A0A0C2E5P4_9STAP|nr:type II toxin-antitoxin system RelE/ParE family toxin [Salinicoccus roseus]KIH70682.1 RelE/StbE family addiction module toxin [Salinicoccus roseus]MDB0580791.1 type II toxin-antitoxin system RelE/ParE family toxin [Salinicoccus roseus]